MDRRVFVGTLAAGLLAAPLAAEAQRQAKIPRIAILGLTAPTPAGAALFAAFRERLRELGWVEGRNIMIEYRHGEGSIDRMSEVAGELARERVDIILATSMPATAAAKQATSTIPIVMMGALDAQAVGLVGNLGRPGGNITGLTEISIELIGKRLQLLKEAVPGVSRLGFLGGRLAAQTGNVSALDRFNLSVLERIVREIGTAAESLGMAVQVVRATTPEDIRAAFRALGQEHAQALYVLESPTLGPHRPLIGELALQNRLPTVSGFRGFVDAGCLMSYGANFFETYRHGADYVDKILKGAKPGDLPVEQPTKFELVINLKTAKALGLTIPPSVLGRADELIQ